MRRRCSYVKSELKSDVGDLYLPPSSSTSFPLLSLMLSFLLFLFEGMLETNTLHHQTDFLNLCFAVSVRGCERVLSLHLCVEG